MTQAYSEKKKIEMSRCHQNQLKFPDRNLVKNKISETDKKRGEGFVGSVYIPRDEKDHHVFYFFSPPVFKDFLNATLFLSFYLISKAI